MAIPSRSRSTRRSIRFVALAAEYFNHGAQAVVSFYFLRRIARSARARPGPSQTPLIRSRPRSIGSRKATLLTAASRPRATRRTPHGPRRTRPLCPYPTYDSSACFWPLANVIRSLGCRSGCDGDTVPLEHSQQLRDVGWAHGNLVVNGGENLGSQGVLPGDLKHPAATLAVLEAVHRSARYMNQVESVAIAATFDCTARATSAGSPIWSIASNVRCCTWMLDRRMPCWRAVRAGSRAAVDEPGSVHRSRHHCA
jgi:hypothetical protein